MKRLVIAPIFILLLNVPFACKAAKPLTDDGVRDLIISGNINAYEGECPCPYSLDNHKLKCGDNSAYSVYPGQIKCYPGDISKDEVKRYRQENQMEAPKYPWEKDKKEGF